MREPEPDTIRRAQAGDLRAFESLVRAYQGDAWRFAYHLTRNRAAADDVTQEAFVRAFRAIASYRGEWKFTAWLLRIVRNCAIDVHRRARREERLLGEVVAALPRDRRPGGSEGGSTGVPGSGSEDRLRIAQALRDLPEVLREPFVVIEVLGFSYAEAATILSVKVGTLKSRMHRARAHLMRSLGEAEAADEV